MLVDVKTEDPLDKIWLAEDKRTFWNAEVSFFDLGGIGMGMFIVKIRWIAHL